MLKKRTIFVIIGIQGNPGKNTLELMQDFFLPRLYAPYSKNRAHAG